MKKLFSFLMVTMLLLLSVQNLKAQPTYCTTGLYNYGCVQGDMFTSFNFGSINQTGLTCPASFYNDYTSISTNFTQGITYPISGIIGYSSNEFVGVWIDFNDDGTFSTNEMVYASAATVSSTFSDNITIPANATPGTHRLRVRLAYGLSLLQTMDPCLPYDYGCCNDYMVTISLPPCPTPPAQPTALSLTPGANNVAISFTASASTDHYFILRNTTGLAPTAPVNGTNYAVGDSSLGAKVIAYQTATTITDNGLNGNTHYYYYIYAANSSNCIGTSPAYLTTTPLSGNVITNCPTPAAQPTELVLNFANSTTVSGIFKYSASADHYLIVRNTTGTAPSAPVNGTTYSSGNQLTGSTFVSYQANSTDPQSFTDTYVPGLTYYYFIYAANSSNCPGGPSYLAASPLTAHIGSNCTAPAAAPTSLVLTPSLTTVAGSFTASAGTPAADHYLVVRSASASPTAPVNGVIYTPGQIITGTNNDTVVAYTTTPSFTDNGLQPGNKYYYYIYAANSVCSAPPTYYATPLTGNITVILNGTYTIDNTLPTAGTNFNNFRDAVSVLNLGIAGPVTFNVVAGETFPMTCSTTSGSNYGVKITATGTAANPIVFQRSGIGADPLLSVIGGSALTNDAAVWLSSVSYITFNGIDIKDGGVSGTSSYLDLGYYITSSASVGCTYNTIENSTITLSNTSLQTNPTAIYMTSAATSTAGRNAYNYFYNNTISNAFWGYKFVGVTGYYDEHNVIGTANGGRSVIKNIGFAGSCTANGINFAFEDSLQFYNTLIDSVRSTTGTTAYLCGIQMPSACSNINFYGDTIKDIIGAENYGINLIAAITGTNYIHNCVISNFIETSGNTNAVRITATPTNLYFYNNSIFNLTTTSTSAYGIEGFYTNTTGNYYVYNNNIYNFNGTGTAVVEGIAINSAGVSYIYNNFVSDINNPACSASPSTNGIKVANTSTSYIYYNTVYLNYTSTNASNVSSCMYAAATPTALDMRDNIFINKCNMTTGTRGNCFWWASTTYTNIASTTNNNLYYTTGTNNYYFYNSTSTYATLALYQAQVTPKDNAAKSEDVPFINTNVNNKPYDLHVSTSIATKTESGGVSVTTPIAITTDYYGNLRFGASGYTGTGSAPDIGANEFNGIPVTAICNAPSNPPTALTFTPGTTSITGAFTAATGTYGADHYLIVRSASSNPTPPVNGTTYTAGQFITGSGSNDTVVAYNATTSNPQPFTNSGLTASTPYYYYIYSVNSNCTGTTPLYNATPLAGATGTQCAAPTAAPTGLTFTSSSNTSLGGSFTASASADHYLILRSTSSTAPAPVSGILYTVGQVLGNDTVVAYQAGVAGTNTFTDATVLHPSTTYYYFIFSANSGCTAGIPAYYATSLSGNSTTSCAAPANSPTALILTSAGPTSITGSFTASTSPNADHYLIVRSASSNPSSPVNGTVYAAGNIITGSGSNDTVVAYQTTLTISNTGLNPNVQYYYYIYAANATCIGTTPTFDTIPLSGTAFTMCGAPTAAATTLILTPINTTTMGGTFTASASADHYLILRSTSSTAPSPVNGITYTVGQVLGSDTIIAYQTSTSFTDPTVLHTATLYYYYIIAASSSCTDGLPVYYTSAILTGSAYTNTCTTPTAQPNSLTLTVGTTSVTGSFTAGTNADHYLIVRSTSSTAPIPVNGTTYAAGNTTLGTGTYVVAYQTTLTITDASITTNAKYYYYVFAANSTSCQGPVYLSTSPLEGSITTYLIQNLLMTSASFNVDVVANGAATSTNSTNGDVDGVSYVMVDNTFNPGAGICNTTGVYSTSQPTTAGSSYGTGFTYTLQPASGNNAMQIKTAGNSGAMTLTTPTAAATLYFLGISGSGASTMTVTVTFADATTQQFTGISLGDWCTQTTTNGHSSVMYRTLRNTSTACGTATCEYFYESNPMAISTANQAKNITSINFTTATGSHILNVFGVAGVPPTPACTAPTVQPTALNLALSGFSVNGSFTAPAIAPDHYLIVRNRTGIAPTAPVNGTTYTAGTSALGDTIVAYQTGTTFTDASLLGNTTYYYYIYSANSASCSGGPVYLATSPLTANINTPCTAPTAQPTLLTFSPGTNTMAGSFTASASADNYLIIRSTSSTLSASPVTGTSYTAGTSLGGGTVVAYQSSTSFTDNGPLTPGTLYYYYIFAANSTCANGLVSYYTTSPLTGSTYTICVAPANQPTVLNLTSTATTIAGLFTASVGGADHYLVVRSTSSTAPSTPVNGTTYTAGNTTLGTGTYVVAYQTGTTFTDASLTSNTQYYYYIYASNANTCVSGPVYLSASPLTGNATTICTTPLAQPTILSLSSTSTSISGSFVASASADHYLILRSTSGVFGSSLPVNGFTYSIGDILGGMDTVIAYQTGTTFNDTALNSAKIYYYFVFATNANCNGGPIYLTTSPLTNYVSTLSNVPCVTPANAPTGLSLVPAATSIGVSFTAAVGGADFYLLVRSTSSTLSATPANGTSYAPGASLGGGTVISYQPGLTFTDIGLSSGNDYYYYIYSANAVCLGGPLYSTAFLTGSMYTTCVTPLAQPTLLTFTPGATTEAGTFTASASADHYLIIRSTSSTLSASPVALTTYTAGGSLGGGTIIAYQTGTSFTDNGPLTTGTLYYYFVFASNTICTNGPLYLTTSPLTASTYTSCTHPANQPTNLAITATGSTATGSFTASTGTPAADHYLIVRNTTGILPSTPVNGTTYSSTTQLTGSTFIAYQTTTTLSDATISAGTAYFYYIYAANSSSCSGGPLYATATPIVGDVVPTSATTFTSSGSWTVPTGVTSIIAYLWGGGGSGGGQTSDPGSYSNGGGGGGGACSVNTLSGLTAGNTYTITIGAGGAASTGAGVAGGTTTFVGALGTFSAAGGAGGAQNTGSANAAGGAGGSTGTGTVHAGGAGSTGDYADAYCGNGGGAGGSSGVGGAATSSACVAGTGGTGTYPGGNGGYNTVCGTADGNGVGVAGAVPGGGGSGLMNFTSSGNGGAGANGEVIIYLPLACTYPANQPSGLVLTPSITSIAGSFSVSLGTPTADHYLIVRSASSNPTTPVNGTTYTAGQVITGSGSNDTVVAYQTGTFWTDINLNTTTPYYYYIFAANSSCTGTPPLYLVTNPLTGATSTVCPAPPTATITPTTQTVCYTGSTTPITVTLPPVSGTTYMVNSPLTSTAPANTFVVGTVTPTYSSSGLQLQTDNTSSYGAFYVQNPNGYNSSGFTASFDMNLYSTGGADGLSFNFGDDIATTLAGLQTIGGVEKGITSKLAIHYETYGTNYIEALYNNVAITSSTYPIQVSVTNAGTFVHTSITVNSSNQLTVIFNGTTVINNLALGTVAPAYVTANKSTWFFAIATRSGGVPEGCYIENAIITFPIQQFLYSFNGGTTYQALNTYTPPVTPATYPIYFEYPSGACPVYAGTATVLNTDTTRFVSTSLASQTVCLNGTFTPITVTAAGNGTITYQWYQNTTASTTGGTTLGSANGAQTNSYTPQSTANGTLYYYCVIHSSCGLDKISPVSGAFNVNPVAQPTVLALNPGATSVTGSFTASQGADSYLVLRSTASTYGSTYPVNGTTYSIGNVLGGVDTVVAYTTTTSFTDPVLNSGTVYYYYVFAVNASCSMTYLTTTPLSGYTVTTSNVPCIAPANAPTNLSLVPGATTMAGSFTAAAGGADYYLIIRSTSSSLNTTPANGTIYSTGSTFDASGDIVVSYQLSSNTSFTDIGLNTGSDYYYYIYSVNAICAGGPLYSATSLNGSMYTNCVTPLVQPTLLTFTTTTSSISGSYTASVSADHYLVVRSTTSTLSTAPANLAIYTAGGSLGGGTIISYQTGTSFTDNGPLTSGTLYYYFVFASNGTCSNGPLYLTTAPLTGNTYKSCYYAANQPTNLVLEPTSATTMTGFFTASAGTPGADHYLIIRSTSNTLSATPANGTTYTAHAAFDANGDTVIAYQTGTSFTDNGPLTTNISYNYFVFAVNANACNGPAYLTTSPLTANATTNCSYPLAQPTVLSLAPTSTSAISGTFVASATADHYLIVRSASSNPTAPLNGTVYTAGQIITGSGNNDTVVAYQTGTTFTNTGLSNLVLNYYYYVYAVNANCVGGPLYQVVLSPLTDSVNMLPLNGIYTIGATGNYPTFNAANTALNALGVGGPVTFNVQPGTYNEQVSFVSITGASATNTITFSGVQSDSTQVKLTYSSGSSANYTVSFNVAKYISLQHMSIIAANSTYAIAVYFTGADNNISLISNYIQGVFTTTDGVTTAYTVSATGGSFSYLTFIGNYILNGSRGFEFDNGSNVVFQHNYVKDCMRPGEFNTDVNLDCGWNTLYTVASGLSGAQAFFVSGLTGVWKIHDNNISNFIGARSLETWTNSGTAAVHGLIYNNFIYTANNPNSVYCLDIGGGFNYTDIVFNTIQGSASNTTCLFNTYYGCNTYITFENNIVSNPNNSTTNSPLLKISGYESGSPGCTSTFTSFASANYVFDYNDYFTNSTTALVQINISTGTTYTPYTSLSAYKAFASPQEQHSLAVDPQILIPDNPYLVTNSPLDNMGTYISWVTTDIYGDIRQNPPAIGCYEPLAPCVTPLTSPYSLSFTSTPTTITGSYNEVSEFADHYLIVRNTTGVLNANPISGKTYNPGDTVGTGGLAKVVAYQSDDGSDGMLSFTDIGLSPATHYYYFIYSAYANNCGLGPVFLTSNGSDGNDLTGDTYTGCPTPTAQPSSLVLTPGSTTVSGSFTATPSADSYLIARNTTGNAPTPMNGTLYNPNDPLGDGNVVAYQTGTSISDTGLTGNTLYYYFIFAATNSNCSNGPAYLTTLPLTGNVTTNCADPAAQPTNLILAAGSTTVNGSFTAEPTADHYLIVRNTTGNVPTPMNGTTYNVNDPLGDGNVLAYQTGTTISDAGLLWNTQYYYFVFSANSICNGGPAYLAASPLTGSATTTIPPSKTLNVYAMIQGFYNAGNPTMNQPQDVDDQGNNFNKWPGEIVDTITVQIRSTMGPDYAIEQQFSGSYINADGSITLSGTVPYYIIGYQYIVLRHWECTETWSDSVDFTPTVVNYNFFTNPPSTQFPQNMTNSDAYGNQVDGNLLWSGDITNGNDDVLGEQDGYITLDDVFLVYDANLVIFTGYSEMDLNGDGYVTLDDVFLVYDNNLVIAQTVNPITLNSKKK